MARKSIMEKRAFFSYKEATAYTAETTARFEGFGKFTPPKREPQKEMDRGKTGTGQHGTRQETQAIFATWSYETERLSEVAFLWCMGLGRAYTVNGAGPYQHELYGQLVAGRTLPTFTIEYGNGTSNEVLSGAVINEITFTGSSDGNGVCKCTVTGFANSHIYTAAALTLNTAGTISSASEDFSAEPLLNFRGFNYWISTAADDVDASDVVFGSENLVGTPTDIAPIMNSFNVVWSNNLTPEDMLRGAGHGVLNLNERKDPALTLELGINKDAAVLDVEALSLADTNQAIEFNFTGPYISTTVPFGFVMIFTKVNVESVTRGEETPIPETVPVTVFEDANHDAIEIYIQSSIAKEYNDTLA